MMAPLPPPHPVPAGPAAGRGGPRVRLEVRTGGGRAVGYEVGGDEFLIGGAAGCDLRLPVANLPPVALQITRKVDGVRVRRPSTALAVLLNDLPLPANTPTPVGHGDRLSVAGIDITFDLSANGYLSPRFIPVESLEPPPHAPPPTEPPSEPSDGLEREAALAEREREVEAQAAALTAERQAWESRKREMEAEFERICAVAPPSPDLSAREEAVAAKERELAHARDELADVRERLAAQYGQRRDELAQMQQLVREANARLQDDRRAFEEERDRYGTTGEEVLFRKRELDAELARHGATLDEARRQREGAAEALAELDRRREAFAADREILDNALRTFEAERRAEAERLEAREAAAADREAGAARREESTRADRAAFEADRRQFADDLVRLERRQAAVEEREREAAALRTEALIRVEQLKRDAGELEDAVRQADEDRERLRAEADRLDRQRADLDAQAAAVAGRATELEAQQAVLVVLRTRLDRTREETEREAVRLAAARAMEDDGQAALRDRIRDAEQLRAELSTVQESTAEEQRRLAERDSLLAAGLEEIRHLRDALAADEARLREREADLDARAAEFAEQAGSLKGRLTHAVDLQARLEADRAVLRERETSLAQTEDARQSLQEQLRRRAEELVGRSRALDELARAVAADTAALDHARAAVAADRLAAEERAATLSREADGRAADLDRAAAALADREAALVRQVSRLKDVGRAVAAERKSLAEARAAWEADRAAFADADRKSRDESDRFRREIAADIEALRSQAPELEEQSKAALDRLTSARDMLRGHLGELHDYARQSRADLDALREQAREEGDRLRGQGQELERAKADHRLAVTAFRQQLIEWQGRVAEMRRVVSQSESRLEAKEAAVSEAARQVDATTQQLAEQAEDLKREREAVARRRTEVDRHLSDMREWYRRKLREVAAGRAGEDADMPPLRIHEADPGPERERRETPPASVPPDDLEPGDLQLGQLLQSLELVDADTLAGLWAEAGRQRRTLRQVLLASGVVTLYQLALIEAGNLDRLVLGRFRVVDRLRATLRESVYRVFDPMRADGKGGGLVLLRHLSEADAQDAVRPDEFRQRFAAARDAAHPNLAGVLEVLDVNGRPAVLEDGTVGLPGSDFPPAAAHPGCWVRLVSMAAAGLDAAHRAGLVHGRLTADSLVLTADGVLKVTGFADPPWLDGSPAPGADPSPAADLRALGQAAFGWSQLVVKKRGTKPFPESLVAVVRRLEADAEPPMEDTVSADRPYESAAELVADLKRVAKDTPFSDDAWEKLLRHAAENAPGGTTGFRQSA